MYIQCSCFNNRNIWEAFKIRDSLNCNIVRRKKIAKSFSLAWKAKNVLCVKKSFEVEELEVLIDEDCCWTQEEDRRYQMGVTHAAISKCLKQLDTFKSKEIECYVSLSQKSFKNDFACQKSGLNATKRSNFYLGL